MLNDSAAGELVSSVSSGSSVLARVSVVLHFVDNDRPSADEGIVAVDQGNDRVHEVGCRAIRSCDEVSNVSSMPKIKVLTSETPAELIYWSKN